MIRRSLIDRLRRQQRLAQALIARHQLSSTPLDAATLGRWMPAPIGEAARQPALPLDWPSATAPEFARWDDTGSEQQPIAASESNDQVSARLMTVPATAAPNHPAIEPAPPAAPASLVGNLNEPSRQPAAAQTVRVQPPVARPPAPDPRAELIRRMKDPASQPSATVEAARAAPSETPGAQQPAAALSADSRVELIRRMSRQSEPAVVPARQMGDRSASPAPNRARQPLGQRLVHMPGFNQLPAAPGADKPAGAPEAEAAPANLAPAAIGRVPAQVTESAVAQPAPGAPSMPESYSETIDERPVPDEHQSALQASDSSPNTWAARLTQAATLNTPDAPIQAAESEPVETTPPTTQLPSQAIAAQERQIEPAQRVELPKASGLHPAPSVQDPPPARSRQSPANGAEPDADRAALAPSATDRAGSMPTVPTELPASSQPASEAESAAQAAAQVSAPVADATPQAWAARLARPAAAPNQDAQATTATPPQAEPPAAPAEESVARPSIAVGPADGQQADGMPITQFNQPSQAGSSDISASALVVPPRVDRSATEDIADSPRQWAARLAESRLVERLGDAPAATEAGSAAPHRRPSQASEQRLASPQPQPVADPDGDEQAPPASAARLRAAPPMPDQTATLATTQAAGATVGALAARETTGQAPQARADQPARPPISNAAGDHELPANQHNQEPPAGQVQRAALAHNLTPAVRSREQPAANPVPATGAAASAPDYDAPVTQLDRQLPDQPASARRSTADAGAPADRRAAPQPGTSNQAQAADAPAIAASAGAAPAGADNSPQAWARRLSQHNRSSEPAAAQPAGHVSDYDQTPAPQAAGAQPANRMEAPLASPALDQETSRPMHDPPPHAWAEAAPSATGGSPQAWAAPGQSSPEAWANRLFGKKRPAEPQGALAQPGTANTQVPEAAALPPQHDTPAQLRQTTRRFLRPLLGFDPATTPVYRGALADAVAAGQAADAVAADTAVFLAAGHSEDAPETLGLLAHELTHVARRAAPRFVPPIVRSAGRTTNDEEQLAESVEVQVTRAARLRKEQAFQVQPARPAAQASAPALTAPAQAAWYDAPAQTNGGDQASWGDLPAPWEPLPSWMLAPAPPTLPPAQPNAPAHPFASATQAPTIAPDIQPATLARSTAIVAAPVITPASTPQAAAQAPEPDLDALARQVYARLKQRLAAERRRSGS